MKKIKVRIFVILLLAALASGRQIAQEKKEPAQKTVQAILSETPVKIDGQLDENVWQNPGYSDFVQNDPQDGAAPSEKTTVWVAYDRNNLYVAARLDDSRPDKIARLLGRRDDALESDWFIFAVDPYLDRRSGYKFSVNPAGSIIDSSLSNDSWSDDTWDGVWESAARTDDRGWMVEMRIPFDQLRFKKQSAYTWGITFSRIINRKNEQCSFVWIPKGESGYVSRFAQLQGLHDIAPGRQLEIMPYALAGAFFSPREAGNPFQTGSDLRANFGLDAKLALKSNVILDLTVNPDFGQVEADPAEVNLSAFETYYSEKRPFFIEGSSIFGNFGYGGSNSNYGFNFGLPDLFYSRRIGRSPHGRATGDGWVDAPESTNILMAAKLTGKIGSWNVAALSALTECERAEIDLNGARSWQQVEPFSQYSVIRAQKEFSQGRQGLGFMATGVIRWENEELAGLLPSRAFGIGADGWLQLGRKQDWALTGWLIGSLVNGEPAAINSLQRSGLHYFQRPDVAYLDYDPAATSLSGWGGRLALNKQRGNVFFNAAIGALSPGLELNDLGYQWNADIINGHILAGYRWLKPGKLFRSGSVRLASYYSSDFGGNRIAHGYYMFLSGTLLNYWGGSASFSAAPATLSKTMTRGGPLMENPASWSCNGSLWSDSRRAVELSLSAYISRDRTGESYFEFYPSVVWKPRTNVNLSVGPTFYNYQISAQWVSNIEDVTMTATYGNRYIFGRMDEKVLGAVIRLSWIFTPRLSLQFYLQPYLAVGHYREFKELARPRSFDFNVYGTPGSAIALTDGVYTADPDGSGPITAFSFSDPDFNYKSLRGTAVLRWEYRPGSTLYLVWTQDRSDFTTIGKMNLWNDLGDMLTAPGNNVIMLKATYRFKL